MIQRIQTSTGNSGGYKQTSTIAYGSNVKAGSLLIMVAATGVDTPTYTDNNTNTWHIAVRGTNAGNRQVTIAYVYNANAGATTITQTTTNFADAAFIIAEFSGLPTGSDPFDQSGSSNGNANSFTATAGGATAQAAELVIGGIAIDNQATTITGDATFTTIINALSSASQFTQGAYQDRTLNVISTPAITITLSGTQQGAIAIATFKASLATSGNFLSLM